MGETPPVHWHVAIAMSSRTLAYGCAEDRTTKYAPRTRGVPSDALVVERGAGLPVDVVRLGDDDFEEDEEDDDLDEDDFPPPAEAAVRLLRQRRRRVSMATADAAGSHVGSLGSKYIAPGSESTSVALVQSQGTSPGWAARAFELSASKTPVSVTPASDPAKNTAKSTPSAQAIRIEWRPLKCEIYVFYVDIKASNANAIPASSFCNMIIPVRCFTCGKVLADKWNAYVAKCAEADAAHRQQQQQQGGGEALGAGERPGPDGKTARGRIMDELGITSCCCRVVMMTHVDLSLVI